MANAGHLAPYLQGTEVPLENGLLLVLFPQDGYRESQFQLKLGAQLTVVTDGVVEARNASGELFGFERTRSVQNPRSRSPSPRKLSDRRTISPCYRLLDIPEAQVHRACFSARIRLCQMIAQQARTEAA